MSEQPIDGRPKLPAPEERLALPAPPDVGVGDDEGQREAERPRWYKRRRFWIILAIAALLALAAWFFLGRSGGSEEQARPPAVVSVARAQAMEWSDQLTAVGTLRAIQGADVTTELAGTVSAIRFSNGERASRGETLVLLDTSTERAQLRALIAQRDQARLAYARALRLIERGAIAQAEVEQAEAAFENLQAQVEQVRTIIAKKRIEAPFSGELGIRQVSLGQYIAPGTPIVSLQQLSPIFVNFDLPETALVRVREGQRVSLTIGALGGRRFEGTINALQPIVVEATRNVTAQALIPNPDGSLKPGMFADVTVLLPGSRRVVVVPSTAVTTNAYGDSVFLVTRPDPRRERQKQQRREQAEKEQGGFFSRLFGGGGGGAEGEGSGGGQGEAGGQGKRGEDEGSGEQKGQGQQQQQTRYVARTAFVQTGERRGNFIEVTKGLKAGQPVVTAGQLKLEDDAPLQISRRDALRGAPSQPRQP